MHRKIRHHWQGIEELRAIYGARGALAATIHVLRDCQGIPDRDAYRTGRVDPLGFPASRTVQEIVTYSEEEFQKVASQFINDEHKCLLLIGWLEHAPQLLQLVRIAIGNPGSEQQSSLLTEWERAREVILNPNAIQALESEAPPAHKNPPFETVSQADFDALGDTAKSILANLRTQLSVVDFGWVSAGELINPLQLIDLDYANHLANEIPENPTEHDAMVFAAPERLNINAQALAEERSATIITRFQELYLSSIEHVQSDVGFEMRFKVSTLPQYILVIEYEGRFYLRSGMHRAFILARAGLQRIPCFLARNVEMPAIIGPYPVYPNEVLQLARPPKLLDAFNNLLAVKTDYQQTRRLLRVSAEEIAIPVS